MNIKTLLLLIPLLLVGCVGGAPSAVATHGASLTIANVQSMMRADETYWTDQLKAAEDKFTRDHAQLKAVTYAQWEAEDVWSAEAQLYFEQKLARLRARFDSKMSKAVESLNLRLAKYQEIIDVQDKIVEAQVRIQLAVSEAQRRVTAAVATSSADLVSFAEEQAALRIEQKRLARLAETEQLHEEPAPPNPEVVEPVVPEIPE